MRTPRWIALALWLPLVGCSSGGSGAPDCPDAGDAGFESFPCSGGQVPAGRLGPSDLVYRGAFRLPALAADAPANFAWGGRAMAYYGEGDPEGVDAYRGSLFVAGNDSEAPWDGVRACWVAEVSIPEPVDSRTAAELPCAELLQGLVDLRGDSLYGPDIFFELPKQGLQVLRVGEPAADTLFVNWGQHIEDEQAPASCSGTSDPACVAPLAARRLGALGSLGTGVNQGPWWVPGVSLYSLNDYLFEIPADWADAHVGGRRLALGRFRDGGQSSQGPVLVAAGPWLEGDPPAPGAQLGSSVLLHYTAFGDDSGRLAGYEHADEWAGGAWLTTADRSAVIFVGAKGIGAQCWYGWQRCPCGQVPCMEAESVGGPGCFERDGSRCVLPEDHVCRCDNSGCDPNCVGERGWWTQRWESQVLFYDPDDLARVAAGEWTPEQPQPYACLSLDEVMFNTVPPGAEGGMGSGHQRRYRQGAVTYDRARGFLYVTELFGDLEFEQPLIHVWQVLE